MSWGICCTGDRSHAGGYADEGVEGPGPERLSTSRGTSGGSKCFDQRETVEQKKSFHIWQRRPSIKRQKNIESTASTGGCRSQARHRFHKLSI